MDRLIDVLQVILLVASIVGGTVAVVTYRRDTRRRRAEWLMSIYQKFFEEPHYKKVRSILDYQPEEYEGLKRAVESGKYSEQAEQFVDYLNFFEFVGSLRQLGQISERDIDLLFEYYLENLGSHDWVRTFVSTQGFESLELLLDRIQPKGEQ